MNLQNCFFDLSEPENISVVLQSYNHERAMRVVICGGGVIGLLCRGTVRLNVCDGHWTQTETPGQIACYVGR